MDYQSLINAIAGLSFTVVGWFAREMWAAVKELKSDLAHLREELPKTYIARDDYREDMRDIKEMLKCARPARGNDRDVHRIGHGLGQRQIKTILSPIRIHTR